MDGPRLPPHMQHHGRALPFGPMVRDQSNELLLQDAAMGGGIGVTGPGGPLHKIDPMVSPERLLPMQGMRPDFENGHFGAPGGLPGFDQQGFGRPARMGPDRSPSPRRGRSMSPPRGGRMPPRRRSITPVLDLADFHKEPPKVGGVRGQPGKAGGGVRNERDNAEVQGGRKRKRSKKGAGGMNGVSMDDRRSMVGPPTGLVNQEGLAVGQQQLLMAGGMMPGMLPGPNVQMMPGVNTPLMGPGMMPGAGQVGPIMADPDQPVAQLTNKLVPLIDKRPVPLGQQQPPAMGPAIDKGQQFGVFFHRLMLCSLNTHTPTQFRDHVQRARAYRTLHPKCMGVLEWV